MTDRLLGPPLTEAERALVRAEARFLLGTPWRHKGRTARGVDCVGFPRLLLGRVLKETRGLRLPAIPDNYGRTPHNQRLRREICAWLGDPVHLDQADLVTMTWNHEAHHVGLLVPHPFYGVGVIHADNTAAGGPRVVEHGVDHVWRHRFVEGWRL